VLDRTTGQIIPNASVAFEGGPTVTANVAGMYSADGLRSGLFKMTASALGYESQSGSVVRPADGDAQLAFALMPIAYAAAAMQQLNPGTTATTVTPEEADANNTALAYGNITLETDFTDYLVFVDGVLYGKDAKKIKRMDAGDHRVVLQLEGFEDYSTNVAVKARSTHTLQVAKADLTPKVDPVKRAKAHFAEAKEHLDRGLYTQAIEKYNSGLLDDPKNASALQYRGWAYWKAGNVDAARADLVRAANLHAEANRFLDAVACAGHLIEVSPTDPDAFLRRSKYYMQMREFEKAIKDCEMAVKLDKKSDAAQMALAEACFVSGDYKRAAKEFDKGRKLSDSPADVYVRVLISLARGGEDDQVRKKYKDFTSIATPEMQKKLRDNPDWLRVLQIVDPKMRSEG
jgi:tetratricopeptide (TPR) repeat protein